MPDPIQFDALDALATGAVGDPGQRAFYLQARNEAAQLGVAPYFVEIWGAIPSVEEYSKEKVIRELIAQHDLHGSEVLAVGDGPVELRNVKEHGGIALGICSNETTGQGWDETKRTRLIKAGADILVPDFAEAETLIKYLFGGNID